MSKLLLKYIAIVLTIYFLSLLIPTVTIGSTLALLIMGLVLLLVNLLLKPLLLLITLPFNILTLGLFSFVVNAWVILTADKLVYGVHMGGFFNALLAALIIAIVNSALIRSSKKTDNS